MLRQILFGICFALALVDAGGFYGLRQYTLATRFVATASFDEVGLIDGPGDAAQPLAADLRGEGPFELMERVMNRVHKIERPPDGGAADLWAHVQSGGGLSCGGMAALLHQTLRGNRIPSRVIQLQRHLADSSDTHVVVEALVGGKWVIFDPTFNVTYELDGRRLGAQEMAAAVRSGVITRVQPHFHGEVAYPARLETYYTDWRPLFNNVLLEQPARGGGFYRKLPPWRYWYGPVTYYLADAGSAEHLELCNDVYFTVVVVLPVAMGMLLAVILVSWTLHRARRVADGNSIDAGESFG